MISDFSADASFRASILNLLPEFAVVRRTRLQVAIIVRCFTASAQCRSGLQGCKTPRVAEERGLHGAYIATGLLAQDLGGRPNLVVFMGEENTVTKNACGVAASTGLIREILFGRDVSSLNKTSCFTCLACFTRNICFTRLLITSNCGPRLPRYGRASGSPEESRDFSAL